jgi:PEP-CTERM motif-containing protein
MKAIRLAGALALVLCGGSAFPARAATVSIGLSMSYFNTIPGNPVTPQPPPITPPNFVGTQLTGVANFFAGGVDPILGSPDIGALNVGDIFNITVHHDCFNACTLKFSFGGLAGGFTAMAFEQNTDLASIPTPPPIAPSITIGALDFLLPQPPPVRVAGIIVGFDDPEIIGEWAVTLSVDNTTPLPATLPLFASGLGALGLLGWRRKRNQAV